MLKHLNHTLDCCYKALLLEMSKKREKCSRLYFLRDDDMLNILCCENNLERFSKCINKLFYNIEVLKNSNIGGNKQINGFYSTYGEYFPFKTVRRLNFSSASYKNYIFFSRLYSKDI